MNYFILGEAETRRVWRARCSWGTGEVPTREKAAFVGRHYLLGYAPGPCEYLHMVASPLSKGEGEAMGWIYVKGLAEAEKWLGEPIPQMLR